MSLLSAILNEPEDNCVNTVNCLLNALKAKVTSATSRKKLKDHPDYPSLLSISDALNEWKIENLTIRIQKEALPEIPLPFIAHIKKNGKSYFRTIRDYGNEKVIASDLTTPVWIDLTKETFLGEWAGIVTVVKKQEASGEKDYQHNKSIQTVNKIAASSAIGIVAVLWLLLAFEKIYTNGISLIPAILLFTVKLLGMVVGVLLLRYETYRNNAALQRVCQTGTKVNCGAILDADASKLFSWLSWSEIGFFYFSGGFLALLFCRISIETLSILSWLNIMALPYIIFSIYYQWKVAKQWCLLCLIVQGLLATEFVIGLSGRMPWSVSPANVAISAVLSILLSFTLPVIAWFLLRPLLLLAKQSEKNRIELARFKYNSQTFTSILANQKAIRNDPSDLGIVLGRSDAPHTLIKVCNPFCPPCSKAHLEIEDLLKLNPDLNVRIIFTATNKENDIRSLPVKHLMAIAQANNEEITKQALNDWYLADKKEYQLFASKHPATTSAILAQNEKIEAMNQWCTATNIYSTPTYFLNGYQLPKMYNAKDLKYIPLT